MMDKEIMTLTSAAVERARQLLALEGDERIIGLRVSLQPKGCSGMSYQVDYAEAARDYEEVIDCDGVKVFIDPAAVMFLIGSVMDYREDDLSSGFTFKNPNVKAMCGCGESFSF